MELLERPHRRFNPLTGSWVLVSPHRSNRPWQGQLEKPPARRRAAYDPRCYLCPGNRRAQGRVNPRYDGPFVFENDFAALLPASPPASVDVQGILRARSERGLCRVVCFSPRHDLDLPALGFDDVRRVIDVWADQTAELGSLDFIDYVQIFENRGAAMGASNPHPHCQIWAGEVVPAEPARELGSMSGRLRRHGSCLLCDYLGLELSAGERIVLENEHFVVVVPFWAVWPFETLLIPRRHSGSLPELAGGERDGLADLLRRLTERYDAVFGVPFPYSMGFHQSPTDGTAHPECHLHAHHYPPLLRGPMIRKFMVGYEMLAEPQRDLTPERAAAILREAES